MIFSHQFISEMKKKIDLVSLISEYTDLKKVSSNLYIGKCPNPNHNDSNPSFRVWVSNDGHEFDNWACMGCHTGKKDTSSSEKNYGTDCIAFYQWIEKVSWGKAVTDLCKKYDIPLPTQEFEELYKNKKTQMYSYEKNIDIKAIDYLIGRGLNINDIKKWHIGSDGRKITFPLLDRYCNPIAFTRRWIDIPENCCDKYKNSSSSKIFNKSSYFYGLHNIKQEINEIRITEGPMDVILADKYGANNVVATLGTAFTDKHVEVIKSLNKIPVFIMDGDAAGQKAIERAIAKLADKNIYSKLLILPSDKDLCDMSLEKKYDIEQYINDNSLTYGQYKIQNIINLYDSKINELRLNQYDNIKKIIDSIPFEKEKNIMKNYIYERMKIKII